MADGSSSASRNSPLYLTVRDIWVFLSQLYLLPLVFIPFWTTDPSDELYIGFHSFPSLSWLVLISLASFVWVIVAVPVTLLLPGYFSILFILLSVGVLHLSCYPIQGHLTTSTSPDVLRELSDIPPEHLRERWVFINGICVTGLGLQENVDRLSRIFGRSILGIHNKTYGALGDVVECIVQRAFGYYTQDTRVAYNYVKGFCNDPSVRKLVLICHSQGGIIVSNILDQLFADIPRENASKLEVYTFGNAAGHFNNPLRTPPPSGRRNHHNHASPRLVPYIEHYANSLDMVTRWGVLHNAQEDIGAKFCGKIFVLEGATGHLLNQHYLSRMFPLSPGGEQPQQRKTMSEKAKNEVPYLDRIVHVEERFDQHRDKKMDGQVLQIVGKDDDDCCEGAIDSLDTDGDDGLVANSTNGYPGRTVRDVSRLWRYMGGRSPMAGS